MFKELDQLLSEDSNAIEDSYELSPAQLGMLLHTLREPKAALFFQQMVIPLKNPDISLFIEAWRRVVDRHPILRTSFHWEGLDHPIQVVHRQVQLPVTHVDWRDLSRDDQQRKMKELLREDRHRGWILSQAPLLRLTLIQLDKMNYVCIKSHHHLLLDAWSGSIILGEMKGFYRELRSRKNFIYPQPRPYRDYIDWLKNQKLSLAEAFWRKKLAGFITPTPLPSRGNISSHIPVTRFIKHQQALSMETASALRSIAQHWCITLSTMLQGVWGLLLSFWSGCNDVIFGMTVSGRPADLVGVENMVGLFINSLPLRVKIQSKASLEEWFSELHHQINQMQEYEYSPPIQVQGWSEVPRGMPLFETLVTFNSQAVWGKVKSGKPSNALPGTDVGLSSHTQDSHRELPRLDPTNYPLSLLVNDGDELLMDLTADARQFDIGQLIRFLEQLRMLLEEIVESPKRKVGDLSITTASEWRQLVRDWNKTQVNYPKTLCLHELFERTAQHNPHTVALTFDDAQLTYADLNHRANQLAHYLINQGVGPEVLVGLAVERSLEMVVGVLAILKSGGAYVPLDPDYPASRLDFMLRDSKAVVLLTQECFADRWSGYETPVICLDRDLNLWSECGSENPIPKVYPENLAFVIYTSGSSGTPKGVAVPHRVCVNRMHIEPEPFHKDEVLCLKTSLNFIDSVWEMFSTWSHGLSVHLIPSRQMQDPVFLIEELAKARVTRLVLVPSLLRALLESGQPLLQKLPVLRHWISSGEPLPGDLSRLFAEQLPGRVLTNLYGASEIWDATRCDSPQRHPEENLPIGKPMGNCQVYVLDAYFRPTPIGVPGELYVGGEGLARGYHHRADLTAERFLPNPFSSEPGARFYRTGDRVRWSSDGQLDYLGRLDSQIKVRGFRIEPSEIEAVLRRHPGIRQAAVVATAQQQLAAYVVFADGATPALADVHGFARQNLPEYMTPALILPLEHLPLTPSGKIDRRALPTPLADRQDQMQPDSSPQSAVETTIAGIWTEVLKIPRIGVQENFFSLGGHSLLAMQVVSRLRTAFKLAVPVQTLFDAPTIAELALWIEKAQQNPVTDDGEDLLAQADSAPFVDRLGGERQAPQSFAQQRLWFLAQLAPGSSLYNTLTTAPLRGRLDHDALQRALNELARRHETLRTTFRAWEGEPVQIVAPPAPVYYSIVDLSSSPVRKRHARFQQIRRQELAQPFDLAQGPLIRFKLVKLAERQHLLIIAMHHIITDGWSMNVLQRELSVLYAAYRAGQSTPLPPLPLQYADFSIWQRAWLSGERLAQQIDYWKRTLTGTERLQLPTDRPRQDAPSYASASCPVILDRETVQFLRALCAEERATPFVGLLAAFQAILGRYAGQDDVVVGAVIANRERLELEGLIGFFANTLAMRIDLSGRPTFRALLQRAREVCLGAFNHQDLPFERLVEEIAPRRHLGVQPLFQTLFVLQNNLGGAADSTPQSSAEPQGLIFYDLTLALTESTEGFSGALHYSTELFDAATAEGIAGRFILLLTRALAEPDRELRRLDLLTERERQQIFSDWPRSATLPACALHELFEARAAEQPELMAIEGAELALTYGELDCRANDLARRLRRMGVVLESRVALYVERSPEAIIGLLGILKAGGVYTPLDTALPPERIALILADAQPEVILTRRALRSSLPAVAGQVLCLDNDDSAPEAALEASGRWPIRVHPEQLAYILFTSGSTGRPKGVMVEHRNIVQTILNQLPVFGLTPNDRVLMTHALTFDASLGEIFRTLVSGATLCLARREELLPGPELLTLLRERRITTVTLSAVLLAALPYVDLPELKTLTVGGSALPAEVAARWAKGRRLLNGYGPTEAAIGVALADGWTHGRKPPLGRPLPNVRAYVVNDALQLLPPGVPGELYLGGPGLARGYLGRADLTAERFSPDPFSSIPGARLYRTGDRVRWLADGQLDFLGRVDEQVKIRGYRIEPGEIAAALRAHSAVQDAAVLAQPDRAGELRLVAYIAAAAAQTTQDASAAQLVEEWQAASEAATMQLNADGSVDPRLNFAGWRSSFTGAPIPLEEMRDWADSTAARILRHRPQEVLEIGGGQELFEIGCGTGLMLFRLAPLCRRYVGVDFAAGLLDWTRRHLPLIENSGCAVELHPRRADDLDDWPAASFDCVVLNSVIQYFPDVDYLLKVLDSAVRLVRPGGQVFIGDVRNYRLLGAFHAAVQLARAAATTTGTALAQRTRRHAALERELTVEPALFARLGREWPKISCVRALPKVGRAGNELTRYRYDVVLEVAGTPAPALNLEWMTWNWASPDAGLAALRRMLSAGPTPLGVRDIPNARTLGHARLLEWLNHASDASTAAQLREQLAGVNAGVEPEDLAALGRELGYMVEWSWLRSDAEGRFDALFARDDSTSYVSFPDPTPLTSAWSAFANNPARDSGNRNLTLELRDYLARQLPDYMVPAAFVLMDKLPLTAHGKLDRQALPMPQDEETRLARLYVAPASATEKSLAEIWADLLRLDQVGVHDNFFELGGDSILGIRVIARAGEAGIRLTAQDLYRYQTIAELAVAAERQRGLVEVEAEAVTGNAPLTPIQHWFFETGSPEPHHFNWATYLRPPRRTSAHELRQALQAVMAHHDALRLRFARNAAGVLEQHFSAIDEDPPLMEFSLAGLDAAAQRAALEAQAEALQRSLDLEKGPLLRLAWFHQGAVGEGYLLLIVHHIVIDAISWPLLLGDLMTALRQARHGKKPHLPAKTASFKQWADQLAHYARTGVSEEERAFWLDPKRNAVARLPVDFSEGEPLRASAQTLSITWESTDTQALLEWTRITQSGADEALLAILGLALARWIGQGSLLINVERHGRETIGADLDFSRTVGWFANISPLLLELPVDASAAEAFVAARTQIRAIPQRGIGYGLLRYMSDPSTRAVLEKQPQAEVFFNYFGQQGGILFRPADQPSTGELVSQRAIRRHLIEINAGIQHDQLSMRIAYGANRHARATIENFADQIVNAYHEMVSSRVSFVGLGKGKIA